MKHPLTRRTFAQSLAAAGSLALAPGWARNLSPARPFSFVLLGDLHFDRLEHHDMDWLMRTHPNDLRQIENYTRITRDVMPALFATVRETIAGLNRDGAAPVAFVLQAGDLVEGLCGTEALALRHNSEAVDFVRDANLGAPFLFTKGNHDITGEGAVSAFNAVFLPFLTGETRKLSHCAAEVRSANHELEFGNAHFAFFDAYDRQSLEWFEAVATRRTADHLFMIVHPPVVPYGARATWHLYSSARDRSRREALLEILGRQHAMVLGGHIHKFNTLSRRAGGGAFAQLALSSVVDAPGEPTIRHPLSGMAEYTGDQIRVEPQFSPDTEAARRAVYDQERPFVSEFEYADMPGYAVVTIDGPRVTARMYAGTSHKAWRTVDLSALAARS